MAFSASRRSRQRPSSALLALRDHVLDSFDADAWMAVIEEQKLVIARAAGVDPSKVRIQIGH